MFIFGYIAVWGWCYSKADKFCHWSYRLLYWFERKKVFVN